MPKPKAIPSETRKFTISGMLDDAVDRVLEELDGKTTMEIRLIFEREGIVDLLIALRDLRTEAVVQHLRDEIVAEEEIRGEHTIWRVPPRM
jgi:hypothetical protein